MELDHISHSQISMWLRCPRQWEYRYTRGLKVPPSGALILGSCYHKALEVNFSYKIGTNEDLPLPDCLDVYSDAWDQSLREEESIDWGEEDPGILKDEGIELVSTYHSELAHTVHPLKVEERIESEIAGTPFYMIIDLQDVQAKVIDHKTSNRAYTQDDVDRDLQASAAAFVLGRAILFYNHVAIKSKVPRIQVVRTVRMPEDIQWWRSMAEAVLAQMKSGVAPPNPTGWHCSPRFCGYWQRCRGNLIRIQ